MCLFTFIYLVFIFINKLRKEYYFRKTPRISKSPNAKTKELSWEKWDSPEYQLKINEVKQELAGERANISKYQMEIKKVKDELSREKASSKKYKLAYEELLEWKLKCEERETRRAKKYNAILEKYVFIRISSLLVSFLIFNYSCS